MLSALCKMKETEAKHCFAQIRKQENKGHRRWKDANDRLMGRGKDGQREMSLGGTVRDLSVTLNHFPEMGWVAPDTTRDFLLIF